MFKYSDQNVAPGLKLDLPQGSLNFASMEKIKKNLLFKNNKFVSSSLFAKSNVHTFSLHLFI